jgi:hypothetical protein
VKCSTKPKAIEYLASIGMADTVSKYIAELEAENALLKAEVKKLTEAGNAMDNAISEIDPQRAERHRFMRMTDAEYLAVMKWRVTKDPNYNRA